MQQTAKYQFNLIEREDVFSPDPLNENMEKVEGALEAVQAEAKAGDDTEAQARADADAALDARVKVFEAHKVITGTATSEHTTEYLGFTPKLLIVTVDRGFTIVMKDFSPYVGLYLVEGGFFHAGAYADCRYVAFI